MVDMKWLKTCAAAGERLYGRFPAGVLQKLYETREGMAAPMEELIGAMQELVENNDVLVQYREGRLDESADQGPGFFYPTECEGTPLEEILRKADADGDPYASIHLDEKERQDLVGETMKDLDFFIPAEQEIVQLAEEGCIVTEEMTALEDQIRKRGGDPASLKALWPRIATEKMDAMEAITAVMGIVFSKPGKKDGEDPAEKKASMPSMEDMNALMPFINGFMNHVNLRSRKGWRPHDLFKKMHPGGMTSAPTIMPGSARAADVLREAEPGLRRMGAEVDYSSIDSYVTVGEHGERRVVKVGRNDPCPCGSGLKYKKCHGRPQMRK